NVYVTEQLNQIHGIRCLSSDGAFYAFADVRQAMEDVYRKNLIEAENDIAFSEYLLESAGVAVVPGSAFGCEGYMRLSFATSMDNLQQALDRIKRLLK
ncbi:MAG TPA: aminotransferase class I/II-fold pyridoxal phosphate-dependent enzyme, partial [Nitrosomonas sp.]|nr:aminotransferase class I/II-fold pyridoxal phosphate-dependent enzyme [Nitrosomonas sp.]